MAFYTEEDQRRQQQRMDQAARRRGLYRAQWDCKNCGHPNAKELKLGRPIKGVPCERCNVAGEDA